MSLPIPRCSTTAGIQISVSILPDWMSLITPDEVVDVELGQPSLHSA